MNLALQSELNYDMVRADCGIQHFSVNGSRQPAWATRFCQYTVAKHYSYLACLLPEMTVTYFSTLRLP